MQYIEFPNGLIQPPGAARFGIDTLLLAAYIRAFLKGRGTGFALEAKCIELGCGCGAACIALGLERIQVLGIEKENLLVDAARANAKKFHLQHILRFEQIDIEAAGEFSQFNPQPGFRNLIFANPPWHKEGSARPPSTHLRRKAHLTASLSFFCAQASDLLPHHGYYCVIIPARLIGQFIRQSHAAKLGLREVMPFVSHAGEPIKKFIVLTRKNSADDPHFLSPIPLHQTDGVWTKEIRAFCPWLR